LSSPEDWILRYMRTDLYYGSLYFG